MKLLKIAGLASLLHAGYSSYEFTQSQKSHNTTLPFPQDIVLEVFISLLILILDLFLSPISSKLSLINNDVVKPKYKLMPIFMKDAVVEDEKLGAGPFQFVESRVNFTDFQKKRKEYAEWVAQNKKVKGDEKDEEETEKKDQTKIDEEKEEVKEVVKEAIEEAEENKEEAEQEIKKDVKEELENLESETTKLEESKSIASSKPVATQKKSNSNGKKNGKKSRKV